MDNNFNDKQSASKSYGLKETKNFWQEIYEWVDSIVITVVVILMVFTFLFRQVKIDGGSMEPTLQGEERIIISDLFYSPCYGDIVVISSEVYENKPIIKRVIATEGQWVDIRDGKVFVGDSLEQMNIVGEEFIGDVETVQSISSNIYGSHSYPLQVPENRLFVLGDNRAVSLDSRSESVGFVDERQVLGKALFRVYPINKFGSIY